MVGFYSGPQWGTWAPTGMGKGAFAPPPLWKCCKVFCALVVTAKRSVDELFMHYIHNLSSASGGFAPQAPNRGSIPGLRWVTFVPRSVICLPLGKILLASMLGEQSTRRQTPWSVGEAEPSPFSSPRDSPLPEPFPSWQKSIHASDLS